MYSNYGDLRSSYVIIGLDFIQYIIYNTSLPQLSLSFHVFLSCDCRVQGGACADFANYSFASGPLPLVVDDGGEICQLRCTPKHSES